MLVVGRIHGNVVQHDAVAVIKVALAPLVVDGDSNASEDQENHDDNGGHYATRTSSSSTAAAS
jgi:hypothetical protein